MKITEFLDDVTKKGYCSFTFAQAKKALRVSDIAVRAVLRRLKQKGMLAQPLHCFYVIVPPEYRILGCQPAEHFIVELMQYLGATYYIGLLSAAQYHGAAHHKPQQYQVIINQKRRAIICGRVKIVFITKKSIEDIPIEKITTRQSIIPISTPETTAMDLVIYANRSGGLDNVVTVLSELIKKINPKKLNKLVSQTKEITWVQRLGYMFDMIEAKDLSKILEKTIKQRVTKTRTLASMKNIKKPIKFDKPMTSKFGKKDKKWKLIINRKLESDT